MLPKEMMYFHVSSNDLRDSTSMFARPPISPGFWPQVVLAPRLMTIKRVEKAVLQLEFWKRKNIKQSKHLKQVDFSLMFAAHSTIIMIWVFGAAVVFKGFQYLEAKRSKRNISQDSTREILEMHGFAMCLPIFSMLEMLRIPTSRLADPARFHFRSTIWLLCSRRHAPCQTDEG